MCSMPLRRVDWLEESGARQAGAALRANPYAIDEGCEPRPRLETETVTELFHTDMLDGMLMPALVANEARPCFLPPRC